MFRSFAVRTALSYLLVIVLEFLLFQFVVLPTQNLALSIVTLICGLILSAGFTVLNYYLVTKPLRHVNQSAAKIVKGEYGLRIAKTGYDKDIRDLTNNFNSIASEFENLEQMRKQFVSNASHELRSPLTSMQGFLQAILDGTVPDQDRNKYLGIVASETKRLSTMISSMLDLSRLESGKSPIVPSRFEINELIRKIVMRFEPNLVRKEIALDVDFIREQCFVFADKDKIEQVIINLVDNAIKYSPTMSRILVATHIHSKKIYISIKDKGIGISKKDQMFIWDRFYMSDRARTPGVGKGTGLGLSIVKKIIEDHKELIWVESNKGLGSTFIFTLPLFDPARHRLSIGRNIGEKKES